jgi:hypothetical protein
VELGTAAHSGQANRALVPLLQSNVRRALEGPDTQLGFVFSPNFKIGYELTKKISGDFEYYGSLGPVTGFDSLRDQQQIVPIIDLNVSLKREVNAGLGVGVTHGTGDLLFRMIIGYRFYL